MIEDGTKIWNLTKVLCVEGEFYRFHIWSDLKGPNEVQGIISGVYILGYVFVFCKIKMKQKCYQFCYLWPRN